MSSASLDVNQMCGMRPFPNASLEQFLMTPKSVQYQAAYLSKTLSGRLVILGDDDHISIPASLNDPERGILVIDTDQRVLDSLAIWINRLGIENIELLHGDLRDLPGPVGEFEAFYGNPPWSSKNQGHGLRYWLSRALDFCTPSCSGVLTLPGNDVSWVNSNWLNMQEYSAQNGLRWIVIDEVRCEYEHTNQPGLYSQNVHMKRTDLGRRVREQPRQGEGIYR